MENSKEAQKLIPLAKWNNYYDFPSVGSLRQLVFRNTNGIKDKVIKCIGKRRLYIDVDAFFKWVNENQVA